MVFRFSFLSFLNHSLLLLDITFSRIRSKKSAMTICLLRRMGRVPERPGVEITPVNGGDDDNSVNSSSVTPVTDSQKPKGSKLESTLDKLGLQKRKARATILI